jgi:ParB family chromosome partitioning protein
MSVLGGDVVQAIQMWPARRVYPNPLNPRGEIAPEALDELTASVREVGIITPLLVTPHREGVVVVVNGHRRRAAGLAAGLTDLPVIVHRFGEGEQLMLMLIENLQRQDLTPIEEARGFARALAGGTKQAALARRLGIPVNRIGWRLELLRLDEEVQKLVHRRVLPVSLARPLLKVEGAREQRRMARLALKRTFGAEALGKLIAARAARRASAPTHPAGGADAAGTSSSSPAASAERPLTRSEAGAMIGGEGVASFAAVRAALDEACAVCDEAAHPEICRACPLPQFVPALLREIGREGPGA